jgi:hypothetical protein
MPKQDQLLATKKINNFGKTTDAEKLASFTKERCEE